MKQKADAVFAQQLQRTGADSADTHEVRIWPLVAGKKLDGVERLFNLWGAAFYFHLTFQNSPYKRCDLLIKMWETSFFMNKSLTSLTDTVTPPPSPQRLSLENDFMLSIHVSAHCEMSGRCE